MKAAIITGLNQTPVYGDFAEPVADSGEELIAVTAAALTHLTKGRASGSHYSADRVFPAGVGVDGVGKTKDGRRVYFALPAAPFGAMAEKTRVLSSHCIPIPDGLDDVTAAAIANPGMSCWAALVERARLQPGETVLVNGATGAAGRLAVQVAKHLGATKVIATGRDEQALEHLKSVSGSADVVIPFHLDHGDPSAMHQSVRAFEDALQQQFALGVDVVLDYLWGKSAETVIAAAKAGPEGRVVRFVQIGEVSQPTVELRGAALRSSALVLMGSGINSVPLPALFAAVVSVFHAAKPANFTIYTRPVPLSDVEKTWNADTGKDRVVFLPGK
jgi:NADPH:quinone reductase-like Zn-dependent oxidoreductase